MDLKQKEILNSSAPRLAELIDFDLIAEYLRLGKLVSGDKIQEIVVSTLN